MPNLREKHFTAKTPATKEKCREQDKNLRAAIGELLKRDGWDECMTSIKTELKTIRMALASGRVPNVRKHEAQLDVLLKVSEGDGLRAIPAALDMLGDVTGAVVYRRELLRGDPRQLPPIGAGRPFVDIVNELVPAGIEAVPV